MDALHAISADLHGSLWLTLCDRSRT